MMCIVYLYKIKNFKNQLTKFLYISVLTSLLFSYFRSFFFFLATTISKHYPKIYDFCTLLELVNFKRDENFNHF